MPGPTVSVVTVSDDHPPDLDTWASAVVDQVDAGDFEVVLVDPGVARGYGEALEEARRRLHSPIRLHLSQRDGPGRAAAYNEALRQASGEIVLFLGPDYIPAPTTVAAHRELHRRDPSTTAVGIGPALLAPPYATPFARWLERSGMLVGTPMYEGMESVLPNFFFVGNASVKRVFLDRVGPFDETYCHHTFDDYELGLRLRDAGMHSHLVPEARADHHHVITPRSWGEVVAHTGASARAFERTHPGPFEWDPVVAIPPWQHQLRALFRLAAFVISRRPGERERYYRRRLHAAFARGYHRPAAAQS